MAVHQVDAFSVVPPRFGSLQLGLDPASEPLQLHNQISSQLHHLLVAALGHTRNSERSTAVQVVVVLVAAAGEGEDWSGEFLSRLASLLTLPASAHHTVESAGVPAGLDRLTQAVQARPGWREGFSQARPETAKTWLKQEIGPALQEFTEKFGHRCLKEFELRSRPW